jgi:hypothetical protein
MHILSSSTFRIVDHVVPCQHIREYPAATVHTQEDTLYLAVKQYIPHDNQFPRPGDVTILGGHANGLPKVSQGRPTWVKAFIYHHIAPSHKLNEQTGTLRAPLGRDMQSHKVKGAPHPKHLDGRCGTARTKRCH